MKRKLLRNILHDFGVICLIGARLDFALFAVLFLVLWLASGLVVLTALAYVRSALMFVGALVLLVCGGLLLFQWETNLGRSRQWTKYFRRAGLFPVALGVAIFLLSLAVALDYVLYVPV